MRGLAEDYARGKLSKADLKPEKKKRLGETPGTQCGI